MAALQLEEKVFKLNKVKRSEGFFTKSERRRTKVRRGTKTVIKKAQKMEKIRRIFTF